MKQKIHGALCGILMVALLLGMVALTPLGQDVIALVRGDFQFEFPTDPNGVPYFISPNADR